MKTKADVGLPECFAIHGLKAKIAREIGITPQAINNWSRVPADRVRQVAQITGLSCHDIRPDVYEPPEQVA